MTAESKRLNGEKLSANPWRRWGPYLSERQWGTVREDFSRAGSAWDYFTHDQARYRAYRAGEDGIAGISDDKQLLCFSLAMWNGADPILKERLFGLTNGEGNHGEDVKECYYYLDSTPTHSYMKYLYKYPQREFPYDALVRTNRGRSRDELEFELIDTGVFDEDRYFDVITEYAKAAPDELLIRITAVNRGPQAAEIHLLPTLLFRNTWDGASDDSVPEMRKESAASKMEAVKVTHPALGAMFLYAENGAEILFTNNETNTEKLSGASNSTPYVKDGFHEFLIRENRQAVNSGGFGTKVAAYRRASVLAGGSFSIKLRLSKTPPADYADPFGTGFDSTFALRTEEADEFYRSITPANLSADAALVYRQALAGMLWGKQYYQYDVNRWLKENGVNPFADSSATIRNKEWFHMVNRNIISMPDKWEYPWYAAWDLAFHAIAMSKVDPEFAKNQLEITLGEKYLHPNGQIPAYEWNFSDVNPPVHAWASVFLHRAELSQTGRTDFDFLNRIYSKLLANFTWWVNRKDRAGRNVFEGGFLGLDNIGVFDRSAPLPTGGYLEQADGTAWMAFYSQCMFELSAILAEDNPAMEEMCIKFADHILFIAGGMNRPGDSGMWDEEDGFYYDVLRLPDGTGMRLKVRSLVGLLPICATHVIEAAELERFPRLIQTVRERLQMFPELAASVHPLGPASRGVQGRVLSAMVDEGKLRRILSRMFDEGEFLSPYGIRSLSRHHKDHPYVFKVGDAEYKVDYQPGDSNTGAFGGNSNWRGPVWLPTNSMIIRALLQYYLYFGESFQIEFPSGSGRRVNLFEAARELSDRISKLFLLNGENARPMHGPNEKLRTDPNFRDHILFYEYFNGDTGAGIGASHQTGWTGLVAKLMEIFAVTDQKEFLELGFGARR